MPETAITVENVSKRYRIGVREKMHDSLAGAISSWLKRPISNYKRLKKLSTFSNNGDTDDIIWALRDVSFEVKEGEVLGVIGKNGAGKSTLLKILSRITTPSSGSISIKGRVSSLLEVGTGFHPELTGRENIYLNGTIIGMTKKEIDRKFDEIVEFSGVRKFIDTPIKRYSTGMGVRLAFAIAAHIEPEILIIDEVLAVGDAEFQKKCIGKMSETAKSGRTVLFVSHNMPSITGLCNRVILLKDGRIELEGDPRKVISHYLGHNEKIRAFKEWSDLNSAPGNEIVRLRCARVIDRNNNSEGYFDIREPIAVEITYDVLVDGHVLTPVFFFYRDMDLVAFVSIDQDPNWKQRAKPKGRYKSRVWIPGNFLADGEIMVSVGMTTFKPKTKVHFDEEFLLSFQVIDSLDGNTARGEYAGDLPGVVRPLLKWETMCENGLPKTNV